MKTLRLKKDDCNEINESDIAEDIKGIKSTMRIRGKGEFVGKAIYLSPSYDYVLGIDNERCPILVPLKKCCK